MEVLAQTGTGIGCDNPWRGREGVGETSVLERRSVGSDYINREDDADETDRVEALTRSAVIPYSKRLSTHLSCAVCVNVLARRAEDQTQCGQHNHSDVAVGSVPQVENLGEDHVCHRAHDVGDDGDDGNQGVGLEIGCDESRQVTRDRRLESVDGVGHPHAKDLFNIQYRRCSSPDSQEVCGAKRVL